MNNNKKKNIQKKKSGFTIIEISIVLSIMLLLMAVFIPTVSGVVDDSKKTGVVGEAQTVVFAWQTINSKTNKNLPKTTTKSDLVTAANDKSQVDFSEYFNLNKTKSLSGNVTVETCMKVVEGESFAIDTDGVITLGK
ncbi:MAG: type II secretion system protein [Clostridium sp.]